MWTPGWPRQALQQTPVSLRVAPAQTTMSYGPPLAEQVLRDNLTAWDLDGAAPEFRPFYSVMLHTFPTGLLPHAVAHLQAAGCTVSLEWDYYAARYTPQPELPGGKTLRPEDQQVALRACLERQRGIVWAPTAFGKTVVMAGVLHSLHDLQALVLCHNVDLVDQTVASLEEDLQEHVGVYHGDRRNIGARIVVTTVNTLHSARLSRPDDYAALMRRDVVVCDESQTTTGAQEWWTVTMDSAAPWRFGFSGTPFRNGDTFMEWRSVAGLGPVIYRSTVAELAARDSCAQPRVWLVWHGAMPCWPEEPGWHPLYQAGVEECPERNAVGAACLVRAAERERSAIAVVSGTEHGKHLAALVTAMGVPCSFVYGKTGKAAREASWQGLRDGTTPILVVSKVGEKGLNIPRLRVIVYMAGMKANTAVLQAMGRGLRPKVEDNVLDMLDMQDFHHATLQRHTLERIAAYHSEGLAPVKGVPEWLL